MMGAHVDPNTLAAFVDQRLDDAERAAVVEHLAACGECRATLAGMARGAHVPRRSLVPAWLPVAALVAVTTAAGLVVWRNQSGAPEAPPGSGAGGRGDVTLADPGPEPPPATGASPPSREDDDLARRRGGERRIGDKTFQLTAGEWVDEDFDPLALLPAEEVSGAAAREATLARVPELRPYVALGGDFLVVHDGVVYRFRR